MYLFRHGRILRLREPQLFTEWVQWRKWYDDDPRQPPLADKILVKEFVARRIGNDFITPTIWYGDSLPERPLWPMPFVVKSSHGCNQYAFIRDDSEDWSRIRRRASKWLRRPYGIWLDEWAYRDIDRNIMVEPFIGNGHAPPVDYKLYVFDGTVEAIQVHLDREHNHRWLLFDPRWQRVSSQTTDADPTAPESLQQMIAAAETLAEGFDFIRCDFYEVDGKARFGEITFYPGSGLDPFDPPELDRWLGQLWTDARGSDQSEEAIRRRNAIM